MRFVGLLLVLLLLGITLRLVFGKSEAEAPAGAGKASPVSSTLGAAPPADFATNAQSAAEYTRMQTCLATCAADARTCNTLAADDEAIKGCTEKHARCTDGCSAK